MADSLAAILTAYNQPVELQRVPRPEMEAGALLVRVDAATLCGTDVHIWHGQYGGLSLPVIPGHETAGTIVEMNGERCDLLGAPLNEGDRIIWAYPFCGRCYFCTVAHQPTLCLSGARYGREPSNRPPYLLGGCAEHHYVPPGADIVRVPEEVPSPLAASAACALRTVMHAFERLGPLSTHETVLVQGAGPVGLYAAAVALTRGARRVLMIGAPAARLDVAREWGVHESLDLDAYPEAAARREWALGQTGGVGPDVVIECAAGEAIVEALELVRRGGRVVCIGGGGGNITLSDRMLSMKQLQVFGVLAAAGHHYYQAIEFLATHRRTFPFGRLISGTYSLERTTEALENMAAFREVKPVILPNG